MSVDPETLKKWLEIIAKSDNLEYATMAQMALLGQPVDQYTIEPVKVEVIEQDPTVFFFGAFEAYYCTDIKKTGATITGYVQNGRWPMIYENNILYFNYDGAGSVPANVVGMKNIELELIVDHEQMNTWLHSELNPFGIKDDAIDNVLNWAWYMKDNRK